MAATTHHEDCACRVLDHHGLVAVAQPFVQVSSGLIIGVELLARWRRPGNGDGLVGPDEFINHLDGAGRVPELTDAMLATASGLMHGGRMVSINLGASDLADSALVDRIDAAVGTSGDPTLLCLEVIESNMVPDAVDRLAELNDRGILVAVDDFGAEYSSLARVIDLRVDIVKLDRSLVSAIDQRPRTAVIVGSFIAGMRELGTIVIAEGIETQAELDHMSALGCDVGQGWVCGRPRPVDDIATKFNDRSPFHMSEWPAST